MIASAMFNMPIDTDPQQQEAASPQFVVVRSSSRYTAQDEPHLSKER
jgi:hypothetical protein